MNIVKKITIGFVVQNFTDQGTFISQEFVAGDQVEYEEGGGCPLDEDDIECVLYQPFNMEQK